MANIIQFSKNIRKRGKQVEQGSAILVKRVAKRCLRALTLNSPADKGDLRSNYRVSIGGQATAVIGAYSPGRRLGMGERANANAAYSVGAAKINSLPNGALRKSIKISNNVPYIEKVNGGSVKQTAPFFIERSIAEAEEVIPGFRFFSNLNDDEEE